MSHMEKRKNRMLDEKALSSQCIFWLSIFIPMVSSIILCIPLWYETEFDFSINGYSHFLEVYKLPIGVLSLSIPLVAIVAHIHRTIQTFEQIDITNKKNITDKFFAHQKFITDNIKDLESKPFLFKSDPTSTLTIDVPISLYRKLFPKSSYKEGIDVSNNKIVSDSIINEFKNIGEIIYECNKFNYDKKSHMEIQFIKSIHFIELSHHIESVNHKISLKSKYLEPKDNRLILAELNNEKIKIVMPFHSETELKNYLSRTIFMARHILDVAFYSELPSEATAKLTSYTSDDYHKIFNEIFLSIVSDDDHIMFSRTQDAFDDIGYQIYRSRLNLQKTRVI